MNNLPSPSAAFPSIHGSPPAPSQAITGDVSMQGSMNWDPVRKRLLGSDLKVAFAAATELREGIEIVHTTEFPPMLSALLPAFSSVLAHKTNPNPDMNSLEHKLRNVVLEIISRMPSNEILRPHAPHLVAMSLDILKKDYEENALVASRIIFDLYKVYRSLPQEYVQPYLDFVQTAYRTIPTAVQRNFSFQALVSGPPQASSTADSSDAMDTSSSSGKVKEGEKDGIVSTPPGPGPTGGSSGTGATPGGLLPTSPRPALSLKSISSFRVLTECPLIVMLMFQLYPKFLKTNIPVLISVMMEALAMRAPELEAIRQGELKLDNNGQRLYFSRSRELVAAQAKVLSFLTYLIRSFSSELKPYEERLASNVVALMSTCPREFVSTRKELLVATRHLLNSEFRSGFYRHVDSLLDERVLMGSHHRYSDKTILRPLGYTTLSDFVHHARSILNMNQMSKVVGMFSKVLHDTSMTLPMSTQYTAVRTLLSVVDIVFHNKDRNPQTGRDILVRILRALVEKLASLQDYNSMLRPGKLEQRTEFNAEADTINMLTSKEYAILQGAPTDPSEAIRDLKSMVRAIIVGHKTVIWYINSYRTEREKEKIENMPPPIGANEEVASAMLKITHSECKLIDRYIQLALPSMKLLTEKVAFSDSEKAPSSDQYRDALTYFAAAFTTFDGYDLRRTFGPRLGLVIDAIIDDPTVMVVPRHFLASNATTSYEFCGLLLNYLVDRMDKLVVPKRGGAIHISQCSKDPFGEKVRVKSVVNQSTKPVEPDEEDRCERVSTTYLQLFERALKSLSAYQDNEKALRPHLKRIVSTCLGSCMEKSEFKSDNYCMLLRYVFRSISAGKFEESYKELLPLIPAVLNGLYRILQATHDSCSHFTAIELFLTIPARLSSLLPHMNLLLRVIIMALRSNSGDLVNLGLRTLEFWVDNLNPEFLYPELSRRNDLLIDLTKALSTHLRPAPYPYGLLTLRLLGKLGGKNRKVLREPMDVVDPSVFGKGRAGSMLLECSWKSSQEETVDVEVKGLLLPLPISRCVHILHLLAKSSCEAIPSTNRSEDCKMEVEAEDCVAFWKPEDSVDMNLPYCCETVSDRTKASQAEAALQVLRSSLCMLLDMDEVQLDDVNLMGTELSSGEAMDEEDDSIPKSVLSKDVENGTLQLESILVGLFYGAAIESTRAGCESLLKGLVTHFFVVGSSHQECFVRIDGSGSRMSSFEEKSGKEDLLELFETSPGSLKPFGYFDQAGRLRDCISPFAFNEALVHYLADPCSSVAQNGVAILKYVLDLPSMFGLQIESNEYLVEKSEAVEMKSLYRWSLIFFENMLRSLCEKCVSIEWNRRDRIYAAICIMIETLGRRWSRKYEIEIVHTFLFALKSSPGEVPAAEISAFEFLARASSGLYGRPLFSACMGEDPFVWDILSVTDEEGQQGGEEQKVQKADNDSVDQGIAPPCKDVLQLLIVEMASANQITRVASRYLLKYFVFDVMPTEKFTELFKEHLSLLRKVLFSRSLRLLPLPEQVGAVEGLAVIIDQIPALIPLDDQHLLAFLSELLKMTSVADGEMTDPTLLGSVVDKNGFAHAPEDQTSQNRDTASQLSPSHSSAIFLRREAIVKFQKACIVLPQELPNGVQLRVASILLLRFVIRAHPDRFFDAETSTPVGNIRPHVVSLLFRSLVSFPPKAVVAAHDTLRDVLAWSVSSKEVTDESKSNSRLPKELLQTCIRPVLLNLRDYTKLSVPLLRGLSRLLSLLSSWFNKTLGEKLLDHLQKWTDPNRVKVQRIWKEGEEPLVAAAIVDLFALLPHASNFVEPLVKTTIKLEACLPAFKCRYVLSPYRKPLAKYLNKHCQFTVAFFFPRLKSPLYSELFQGIIKLDESNSLREYLSGKQCSVTLLNVCFERPLKIIHEEKKWSGSTAAELQTIHGIQQELSTASKKDVALRQELESKKKRLQLLQQDLARKKDAVQVKSSGTAASGPSAEQKAALEDLKRQQKVSKAAYDRGVKDFNECKQRYTAEVTRMAAMKGAKKADSSIRPMTLECMELQHQGFRIVETLMENDSNYLKDHEQVLRAFRWLWRSKGRSLRLQYEESVPPRYHGESKMLAKFLVDYARKFPDDVDVPFDMIRIFLLPTTNDFSFVKSFLLQTVSEKLQVEQKAKIMQRFFALLSGETGEETKTLSIQLIVFPMLQATLHSTLKNSESSGSDKTPSESQLSFLDDSTIKKFMKEVLYSEGKPLMCGDRLKVELLRLLNLFIEHIPKLLDDYRQDIMKFCWTLLKSDDTACKSWAYLTFSRFISVFDTPPKVINQVYTALAKAHQQEGKELVREALELLVAALPVRLSESDFKKTLESTNKIMFEDGNSLPQLAHIWYIIVENASRFQPYRHQLIKYMVNSLNRLGLPPNCPPENRLLAVSVVDLILRWDENQDSEDSFVSGERDDGTTSAKRKLGMMNEERKVEKKQRTPSGSQVASSGASDDSTVLLDQPMADTIVNFLVRLKILLADPKLDYQGASNLNQKVTTLLQRVVSKWNNCTVRPAYFEKVVSMCQDERKFDISGKDDKEKPKNSSSKATRSSKGTVSGAHGTSSSSGKAEPSRITSGLLESCLDIFIVLLETEPESGFLGQNPSTVKEILGSCFRHVRRSKEDSLRNKLHSFTVDFLKQSAPAFRETEMYINVVIEKLLVDADNYHRKSLGGHVGSDSNRHSSRSRVSQSESNETSTAIFAIEIIANVNKQLPGFFRVHCKTMLSLAGSVVRRHVAAASAKQKQGGISYVSQSGASSVQQMYHTPTEGIINESCLNDQANISTSLSLSKSNSSRESVAARELKDYDDSLRSAVLILQIVGKSDIIFSFSHERKVFFQIVSSVLDSSISVHLLMTTVHIVGFWLQHEGSPLTSKERSSLLWKMASFDFNGLSDTVSQPISELVSRLVVSVFKGSKSVRERDTVMSGVKDDRARLRDANEDLIVGKSLTACLLNANVPLRADLLSLYASQRQLKTPGGSLSDGPSHILWQLLHSDFEGLGGRSWLVVFVDLLLRGTLPKSNFTVAHSLPSPRKKSQESKLNSSNISSEILEIYSSFCSTVTGEKMDWTSSGGSQLFASLGTITHGDSEACEALFGVLLPSAWECIAKDTLRLKLVPAIESLLCEPFHSQFLKGGDNRNGSRVKNVLKSFLNGLMKCSPIPMIDSHILVSLAQNYSCWFEALALLDQQLAVLSSAEATNDKISSLKHSTLLAIRRCYEELQDSAADMNAALRPCAIPETKVAASLDMYGRVDEAYDVYSSLIDKTQSGDLRPSDDEIQLWKERWVQLSREQCQLEAVAEVASITKDPFLQLECAWKEQKWDAVRSMASSPALIAEVENGNPSIKMSETLLAVADGKLTDVENLHAQTAQLCLYKWQLLPEVLSASPSHSALLHFFHRLVEIRESNQIMVETSNHSQGKTLPDLKNLLNAWRHRLPNDYEDLTVWDDVFTWRSHMFNAITSNFKWSDPGTLATLHDQPWTAIRLATTARKQDLRETSLIQLNKLTGSHSMDVSDAFSKLREQILIYYNPDDDKERTGGLNLINTTNLSYFDAPQKSEIFRLKAMFLASLGGRSKSNQAYCHSVQICPTYSRAWISWGGLCSSLGALTEKQTEQLAAKATSPVAAKESRSASAKKVAQYLAQAMGCYIEAVQIDSSEKTRLHLPKCLWMLTKDGSSPGVLCQTLESRGNDLPVWVWLPWIPQLLSSLCRIEGPSIKTILSRLVKAYPQAVYYSLRAFYLERRDVERSKGVTSSSPGQHMSSVACAEEMMSTLRRSHASLWSSLEAILEELIVKFRPSFEEELLTTISALLERAESHTEKQAVPGQRKNEDEDAMVSSWSKTLSRIAAKFFRDSESSSTSTRRDERVKRTAEFKRKYKADFEADFKVNSTAVDQGGDNVDSKPQFRLEEYIERLQKWKRNLEIQVSRTPKKLPLIESSHSLAMFVGHIPDLWPGSCDPRYLQSRKERDSSFDIDNGSGQPTTSSSAAAAKKAAIVAAQAAASAAAREGVGGEYGGGSAAIEIPGQYCPNSWKASDVRPSPELHTKLIRFEPYVEVLRRNDQLVRRATMVGSDGKKHKFLLQFAIPYWTRTDERTSQTNYVVDKFLRKNILSARNYISVQPNPAIPVAQRLRMTLDVETRLSLDQVLKEAHVQEGNLPYDKLQSYFLERISSRMKGQINADTSDEDKSAAEKSCRLAVYREICENHSKKSILLDYIQASFDGPETLFQFRRAFAAQLAANSLFQYAFSAAERTPSRFVLMQCNGRVLSPDFRVSYTNQGFIDEQVVPFRMTPNVVSLLGQGNIEGRFLSSFAIVADAIRQHKDEFDAILRLLMRDDILAWYSKSLAKSDSKTQELERQLIERVSKNVATLQSRFSECSPRKLDKEKTAETTPVDQKARDLYGKATNPESLCMMPLSYQAWI